MVICRLTLKCVLQKRDSRSWDWIDVAQDGASSRLL